MQATHLVMPLIIEPSKPHLCHDERFLNLWMRIPKVSFDNINDLPRYVDPGHFQSKLDDKSGYDHILLSEDSRELFGLFWKGWLFVHSTIPFGWSPSAYVYYTTGLGPTHFIRSKEVPLSQYIDDRHVGQLRLAITNPTWSDLDLAKAGIFIAALVLVFCGYFIGLKKICFHSRSSYYIFRIYFTFCKAGISASQRKETEICGSPRFHYSVKDGCC